MYSGTGENLENSLDNIYWENSSNKFDFVDDRFTITVGEVQSIFFNSISVDFFGQWVILYFIFDKYILI